MSKGNNKLTRFSKRIGDYIASKIKDDDNELFDEIKKEAIAEFIEDIQKNNPILASWIRDYTNNNPLKSKKTKNSSKPTITYGCGGSSGSCGDNDYDYGGCGPSSYGGC